MPDAPTRPKSTSGPPDPLVDHLLRLVRGPDPRLVLINGRPGSGKSSLLRELVRHLGERVVFLGYRTRAASGGPTDPGSAEMGLILLDRERVLAGASERDPPLGLPVVYPPSSPRSPAESFPPELETAMEDLVRRGGGTLLVDAWDRRSEEAYRRASGVARGGLEFVATARALQERLGRLPLSTVLAMFGAPDPALTAAADCALSLGTEEIDGVEAHVATIEKTIGRFQGGPRLLYSVDNGSFYCPRPQDPPSMTTSRAPDPDPEPPAADGGWPGDAGYAHAFGRLRWGGLTGLELYDETPDTVAEALLFPMVAATLLSGGRVVWVPSPMIDAGRIHRLLGPIVARDRIRDGLRVLSGGPGDDGVEGVESIVLPVRRRPAEAANPSSPRAHPVEPMFPEAFQFLQGRARERPAVFVLSFEGLRALATMSGTTYHPSTLPLIVGQYLRIERFHGIGIARAGDPLAEALLPAADPRIKIRQRHGQTVLTGVRPRTNAFLMDWADDAAHYRLVPLG